MASIARGPHDPAVEKIQSVLDEYERQYPSSRASVYRQNSASIRVRILDDRFRGTSKGDRHDDVWNFLVSHLSAEDIEEIALLLLLTPDEQRSSFMNSEFDDPVASEL